ncbi:hypothetical protein [Bifidobacterium subtile]|uniref:hypothetical protein n=1 Tax=Bifidobacterium subtile TaxID=77635 RepID=UPI00041361A4|nr:hypothetical protein [Bifidobacterium subtile]QOL36444.1 hypothetical protein BS3272_11645 [Bifidobacterium subtile]QOL36458.1 hypothetical protein BS3272_00075 [Bifidobacterium subtile]
MAENVEISTSSAICCAPAGIRTPDTLIKGSGLGYRAVSLGLFSIVVHVRSRHGLGG